MEITIAKVRNFINGFIRLDTAKKRIDVLESMGVETIQSENIQRRRTMEKSEKAAFEKIMAEKMTKLQKISRDTFKMC